MGEGERPAIVTCANCSADNAAGRRFCDQCGAGLATGCPACGGENRPEARFCGDCGQALTPAAQGAADDITSAPADPPTETAAERRLVSVLFADLVAFTKFSEGRDHELVRDTLDRYFGATREAIERHGGTVEKFIGDAVMAVWGAPRTNEDDAERAVRAALEVIEAVHSLGEDLHVRVAVLTGQAAVTLGATDQGMIAGDLVNTAARLQGVAPPDSVLVGEATMQAASSAVAFEEAGDKILKGKEAPVRAWRAVRVVGDTDGRRGTEGLEPPFVGREMELRLLKDLVNAAGEERRPRLVSITGPAGIGKSRLAWELEKYVDGLVERIYWHRGRSPSYGEGIAFWALGEMVRRRARLAENDDEEITRDRIGQAVGDFVDAGDAQWVEQALLTLFGLEPPPPGGRDALFAAWRTFFERVAGNHTTVLLFEDLHWADDGQLDFIDHLLEWSRDVPLLVVTLARPELLERRPGWGTSARSFNAIGLEPLTDTNMRELLHGLVPRMPDGPIDQVLARADGIPLYAVEMVRTLIADGRLEPLPGGTYGLTGELGELALPDSLRALVAARLDGLDNADRALVQDATVLGQAFDHRALAAITEQDEDAVETRLRALVKRELLEISVHPHSPERGQFSFVQSVIREVAYDTLSRRDRRSRHLAAARYYETIGDDELAAVLATHYVAAYEASDEGPEAEALRVQARLALRGAAERAMTLGSPEQALVHLESALEITLRAADQAELHAEAAQAAQAAARYDDAIGHADSAMSLFEDAGQEREALQALAALATIQLDAGHLEESKRILSAAVERADSADTADVRADLLARLARAHMRLSETDEAIAAADAALALAEPHNLERVIAEAFVNKGSALGRRRRVHEPVLLLRGGAELAEKAGDLDLQLRAMMNIGAGLGTHDLDFAIKQLRSVLEMARRLGVRKYVEWTTSMIPYFGIEEGRDWDAAIEMASEGLASARSDFARSMYLIDLYWFDAMRGVGTTERLAELRRTVAETGSDPFLHFEHVAGFEQLLAGREREAIVTMRQAIEEIGWMANEAYLGLTLSAARAHDLEAAREAERRAQDEPSAGHAIDANRALATAAVVALEGRPDAAAPGFVRATELFREAGWHFVVAVAQTVALDLLPDRPEFSGWPIEARERFERLGARPWLHMLEGVTEGVAADRSSTAEEVPTAR